MNLTILLLAILGFTNCSEDEQIVQEKQTKITVTAEESTITFEGGELTLTVNADGEWSVSSKSDFCTVNRRGGIEGETTIKATISKNTSANERTAILEFRGGKTTYEYNIVQDYDHKAYDNDEITAPQGYKLVWHDEFDSETLSEDWTHENWDPYHVNNELQYYRNIEIDGIKTIEVKNDVLNINCFKTSDGKIMSGRINAKVKEGWKYGYIEASIKLPKGKGTWPAFWMMPVDVDWANEGWPKCGEIDIMEEVGYHPNYVSSSLHAEGHVHTNNNQVTHEMLCQGAEDEFHTYAIEWTSEKIVTYVDGKIQLTYASDGTVKNYPYDKAYYIILNLAWGGDWGGSQGVDESALPTSMQVDYVRVFQKK